MTTAESPHKPTVYITPLLRRLWPAPKKENVTASEIASAISHIFTNSLTPVQTGGLLTALHFTGLDREAEVLSKCALAMRNAALQVDRTALRDVVRRRGRKEGGYRGGLCDIVGTGGDSHNTFNVSTTASVIASALLLIAKHGNRAATSKSGSADLLNSTLPRAPALENVTPHSLTAVYERSNYAFLFAPVFHPGMRYVAPIRKELGWRTIFNLLGPLSNPVDSTASGHRSARTSAPLLEARVNGVARRDLGPAYAEALLLSGVRKAMVVCGDEELDEISCAGPTHCWLLVEAPNPVFAGRGPPADAEDEDITTSDDDAPPRSLMSIRNFTLAPEDFGCARHPLAAVGPGKEPAQNADTFMRILTGRVAPDDPLLQFVLMNAAALFVVSGVCDADTSCMGPGDHGKVITERGPGGGRWKEGMRRARWAVESGEALRQYEAFVEATHAVER